MCKRITLGQRLAEIAARRTAEESDIRKVERAYQVLLKDYSSSNAKGRIYAAIAQMYAHGGTQQSAKVAKHCKKALAYRIGVQEACQLYLYWGEALEASYRELSEEDLAAVRKEIVLPFLKGLKLVLDNQTGRERQTLPAVGKYDYDGPAKDAQARELQRQHRKEMAARQKVIDQNRLVEYRKIFIDRCAEVYGRRPFATDELERLARRILKNAEAVGELLAETQSRLRRT
jgi:hypothetical protein